MIAQKTLIATNWQKKNDCE